MFDNAPVSVMAAFAFYVSLLSFIPMATLTAIHALIPATGRFMLILAPLVAGNAMVGFICAWIAGVLVLLHLNSTARKPHDFRIDDDTTP